MSNLREEDLSWSVAFGCAAASVEWLEGPSGRVLVVSQAYEITVRTVNLSWTHHERIAEMSVRTDILSWSHADRDMRWWT